MTCAKLKRRSVPPFDEAYDARLLVGGVEGMTHKSNNQKEEENDEEKTPK